MKPVSNRYVREAMLEIMRERIEQRIDELEMDGMMILLGLDGRTGRVDSRLKDVDREIKAERKKLAELKW